MSTRVVDTRAGQVAIGTTGQGPLAVLVPAAGRAADDFAPIVPALARRHTVVTLDWPSTGASPPCAAPGAITAATLAGALADVVATLGDQPALIIGHSVGGFAAARLAIEAPARVRALVLIDALGFVPFNRVTAAVCALKGRPAVTRAVEGYLARAQTVRRNAETARVFERVEAARTRADYAELTAAVWRSFPDPGNDLRRAAAAIRCPTLVCWGWLDPVVPVIGARLAARAIPGAQLALFRTGHTPFVEDSHGFLRALDRFLATVPPVRVAA